MKKIIFDCDNTMGVEGCDVDDGLALLYLLGKPSVEILGITTTYGNSNLETVYANTSIMLDEIGRTELPLYKGCPHKNMLHSEAADFIVETVNLNQGDVSILATGSLTNLYAAYLKDHTIFDKVAQIVLMGGITEPLVINGKVLDELNLSCDPLAAECVLKKGNNISVITGNNCLGAFFTEQEFKERLLLCNKPVASYTREKCTYWFKNMMNAFDMNGFHNWDVVAAAYMADSSQFDNNLVEVSPKLQNLEKGLLSFTVEDGSKSVVNLPVIHDLEAFTDGVYEAWFRLDL